MTTNNRSVLFSTATDNWPTPQDFYDRLDAEFNFGLDVCSSRANHKAPVFYALDHDNPDFRDGLAGDWVADSGGRTIWCNPPYGRGIRDWMETALAAAHLGGATVVCLVPVRADSAWWHDVVLESGAEVRYVRGRLKFGDAKNSAAFSSAVVIYRPTDVLGSAGPVTTMTNKAVAAEAVHAPELATVVVEVSTQAPAAEGSVDSGRVDAEPDGACLAGSDGREVEVHATAADGLVPPPNEDWALHQCRRSDADEEDLFAEAREQAYDRLLRARAVHRPRKAPQDRRRKTMSR